MRLSKILSMAIITGCIVWSGSSQAADVAKIGVVDFQRFFNNSEAGKQAQTMIKEKHKAMEAKLKKMQDDIKEIRDRLERESMVMSKEMREEKEREGRIKISDFNALEKKYVAELKELQNSTVSKLHDELMALIEEIGKKEGYLMIIDKTAVYYNPSSIDVTDKLIQAHNARNK